MEPRSCEKTWDIEELYNDRLLYLRSNFGLSFRDVIIFILLSCLMADRRLSRIFLGLDAIVSYLNFPRVSV